MAGEFHELHDLSNDETVGCEELVLLTDAGPYRNVYGKEGAP
ncbi:hypothetical protein [Halorubellus litoreus]|uniref:Uncharacterized protein n=1 Tax=Halorubellus litoreus TaxID=755308 RepID=A0ABD5VGU7_9EURY